MVELSWDELVTIVCQTLEIEDSSSIYWHTRLIEDLDIDGEDLAKLQQMLEQTYMTTLPDIKPTEVATMSDLLILVRNSLPTV